ncbi:MAG: hypothetical protein JRF33_04280 [Deltaproteobacteria bacterium]|nr:hypothetical protein [Deltaproteobacteria bacterium]
MPGIGVVNNPHSRKNKKNPDWMQSLGHIVGSQGTSVATQKIQDLDEMMLLFKRQDIDILAINGGDGSNSHALTAMVKAYGEKPLPRIALLRGGTMNIAANSCKIKGTPAGLMMNLVQKFRNGTPFETVWRDTLEVEGRYGFVFGNGFIHGFLEAVYADDKKTVWTTTKVFGRVFGSALTGSQFAKQLFSRIHARVWADEKPLPYTTFAALAASTVEQIGMNFKPFFRSQERPHSFHLLGAICSPIRFASALPRLYTARKVSEKKLIELVASKVRIVSDQPVVYTLDGENFTSKTGNSLNLQTGPRLEIVVR